MMAYGLRFENSSNSGRRTTCFAVGLGFRVVDGLGFRVVDGFGFRVVDGLGFRFVDGLGFGVD